jgi:hypothetical protein
MPVTRQRPGSLPIWQKLSMTTTRWLEFGDPFEIVLSLRFDLWINSFRARVNITK